MSGWPSGVDRRIFETLDSTMSEAARLAAELAAPTWIFAHEQTAARGRRGRAWSQPPQNFSASLVFRPVGSLEDRALRSFSTALALLDVFEHILGPSTRGLSLKWPNDVLLNGGKIAGILLESQNDTLIIGIGVNLAHSPPREALEENAMPPVSLTGETGHKIPPLEFLDLIAEAFALREAQFQTYGFAPLRANWLARAAKFGEVITARLPGREITGTFQDVDDTGQLVLKGTDGTHKIPAADIYF